MRKRPCSRRISEKIRIGLSVKILRLFSCITAVFTYLMSIFTKKARFFSVKIDNLHKSQNLCIFFHVILDKFIYICYNITIII